MNKVTIAPGCITCGLCASIAPDIFEITDVAHVIPNAPFDHCSEAIKKAAAECPVQVITYTDKEHA